LTFEFEATDPDSDPLSWGKISGPSWLTIGQANGTIYGSPSLEDLGSNTFEIQVSDGKGGTDSHTFSISVEPIIDGDDEDQLDYEWDTIPMSICLFIVIIIAILLLILLLRLLRRKKEEEGTKSRKESETVDETSKRSIEEESDENITSQVPDDLQSQENPNQKDDN